MTFIETRTEVKQTLPDFIVADDFSHLDTETHKRYEDYLAHGGRLPVPLYQAVHDVSCQLSRKAIPLTLDERHSFDQYTMHFSRECDVAGIGGQTIARLARTTSAYYLALQVCEPSDAFRAAAAGILHTNNFPVKPDPSFHISIDEIVAKEWLNQVDPRATQLTVTISTNPIKIQYAPYQDRYSALISLATSTYEKVNHSTIDEVQPKPTHLRDILPGKPHRDDVIAAVTEIARLGLTTRHIGASHWTDDSTAIEACLLASEYDAAEQILYRMNHIREFLPSASETTTPFSC